MQFTMRFGLPRWRRWCGGGPEEIAAERQALTCRSQNFETILREDASFPGARNEIRSIPNLGNIPLIVITRDPDAAQDVAQEAFVKAYRALGRFRQGAPLRPWLLRIVANEAINRAKAAIRVW